MTTKEQIIKSLDGRSVRWLSKQIDMPEMTLYFKMQGRRKFKQKDLDRINERLKSNINL